MIGSGRIARQISANTLSRPYGAKRRRYQFIGRAAPCLMVYKAYGLDDNDSSYIRFIALTTLITCI